jgi:hypothetical protein
LVPEVHSSEVHSFFIPRFILAVGGRPIRARRHASSAWFFVSAGLSLWLVDRALRFGSGLRHVQIVHLAALAPGVAVPPQNPGCWILVQDVGPVIYHGTLL